MVLPSSTPVPPLDEEVEGGGGKTEGGRTGRETDREMALTPPEKKPYYFPSPYSTAFPKVRKQEGYEEREEFYNNLDYTPTFWENPYNVASLYHYYRSVSANDYPEWLDMDNLSRAYDYLTLVMGDKEWVNWGWVHPDDPGRYFLQGMEPPPIDFFLDSSELSDYTMQGMMQKPTGDWTDDDYSNLTYSHERLAREYSKMMEGAVPLEDSPSWMRFMHKAQSSPYLATVKTMLPYSVGIGGYAAITSSATGPGALLAGAGGFAIPMVLGLAATAFGQKFPDSWVMDALMTLGVPTRVIEQIIGTTGQALSQEDEFTLNEFIRNAGVTGDAMEASKYTYETSATGHLVAKALAAGERGVRWTSEEVFGADPAISYKDIILPTKDQVYRIDTVLDFEGKEMMVTTDPVTVDAKGIAALIELRKRLQKGAVDPEELAQEIAYKYGISGELADLAGWIILDPLWLLPIATGKLSNKYLLSIAGEKARSAMKIQGATVRTPIQAFRMYRQLGLQGLLGPADQLGFLQRLIIGIDEKGMIKGLKPTAVTGNPFTRFLRNLVQLTPESKAFWMMGMAGENLGAFLLSHIDDLDGAIKALDDYANLPPSEAARLSGALGGPEWYTIQRTLAGYSGKLNDLYGALWLGPDDLRRTLFAVADNLTVSIDDVLKLIDNTDDLAKLIDEIKKLAGSSADDGVKKLAEMMNDGILTDDALKQQVAGFKEVDGFPLYKKQLIENLLVAFEESTARYAIDWFGIKEMKGVKRMFHNLKTAISLPLLGLNARFPLYNYVNNTITRTIDGIGGYSRSKTINSFFQRLGIEPSRFELGVTQADEALRGVTETAPKGWIKTASVSAEDIIRDVVMGDTRFGEKLLRSSAKLGLFTKLSQWIETQESKQAVYKTMKQIYNRSWKRGVGFDKMPIDLEDALKAIDSKLPGKVYRSIEKSLNIDEVKTKLSHKETRFSAEESLDEAARRSGMDLDMAEELLGDHLSILEDQLKVAQTADDVSRIFGEFKTTINDDFIRRVGEEAAVVAEQIGNQVMSGGASEAVRIMRLTSELMELHALNHVDEWQKIHDNARTMRQRGTSQETINAYVNTGRARLNKKYRAIRGVTDNAHKTVVESLGQNDTYSRQIGGRLARRNQLWDNYFDIIAKDQDNIWSKVDFEEAEYTAMEKGHIELYKKTTKSIEKVNKQMDSVYYGLVEDQFGKDVVQVARDWREPLAGIRQQIYDETINMREKMVGQTGDARRATWNASNEIIKKLRLKALAHENKALHGIRDKMEVAEMVGKAKKDLGIAEAVTEALPTEHIFRDTVVDSLEEIGITSTERLESILTDSGIPKELWNDLTLDEVRAVHEVTQRNSSYYGKYSGTSAKLRDLSQKIQSLYDPKATVLPDELVSTVKEYVGAAKRSKTGYSNRIRELDDLITQYDGVVSLGKKLESAHIYRDIRRVIIEMGEMKGVADPGKTHNDYYQTAKKTYTKRGQKYVRKHTKVGEHSYVQSTSNNFRYDSSKGAVYHYDTQRVTKVPDSMKDLVLEPFMVNNEFHWLLGHSPADEALWYYTKADGTLHTIDLGDIMSSKGRVPVSEPSIGRGSSSNPAVGVIEPAVLEGVTNPLFSFMEMGAWDEAVDPFLRELESTVTSNPVTSFGIDGLDEMGQAKLSNYVGQVKRQMDTMRRLAMGYGNTMRDFSLLNYTRKRGADTVASWRYPYQFWYTRTFANWGARVFSNPAWLGTYGKIRKFMRSRQVPAFPARFQDKMSFYAPYLPEWTTGEYWTDPLRKLMPLEEFMYPFKAQETEREQDRKRAMWIISKWMIDGIIDEESGNRAIVDQKGKVWENALEEALEADNRFSTKESIIEMIMQPALYETFPKQIIQHFMGDKEYEPLNLPPTRMGNAMIAVSKGTWAEGIGKALGSLFSLPEKGIHSLLGVDDFTDWDDYYIDLITASMAIDGEVTSDEAKLAMIEHKGETYDKAIDRMGLMNAFGETGGLPIYALLHGGSLGDIAKASTFGMFPSKIMPQGELEHRGLSAIYAIAREQRDNGDPEALSRFFEKYPEYEARLALWAEPEERYKQFITSIVWDKYMALGKLDKKIAREQFGEQFSTFLAGDDELVDDNLITMWGIALGGKVPSYTTGDGVPTALPTSLPGALPFGGDQDSALLNSMPPEHAEIYEQFIGERNERFPNYYALHQWYKSIKFNYPKGDTPEEQNIIRNILSERESKFPNWHIHTLEYQELPNNQKEAYVQNNASFRAYQNWFLGQTEEYPWLYQYPTIHSPQLYDEGMFKDMFPEYQEYRDWYEDITEKHPIIKYYQLPPEERYNYDLSFIETVSGGLIRQILAYLYNDQPLTAGAERELYKAWIENGRPGANMDVFLDVILRNFYVSGEPPLTIP